MGKSSGAKAVSREGKAMKTAGAPDNSLLSLREAGRLWDLIDLRGAQFQRLLRLALDEGLLDELIRSAASLAPRGELLHQSLELPMPLCEPEITPEMIAAGAEAYLLRDAESLEAPEKTAFSIYLAMEEACKRSSFSK